MVKVLTGALKENAIPKSFRQSVVVLLHKKGRPTNDIANWRPIALANTDMKILSRLLVTRMSPGMTGIIHKDQTGFTPGRNIAETALNAKALIEYTNRNPDKLEAALLMLDQRKAYDLVNHEYMAACFSAFGFPQAFVQAINNLYSNLTGAIIIN